MKKDGFTMVELILVIVIIGIVGAITIPNIMESLSESKKESGESVEKLLKENLKLYNMDNEDDLWCLEDTGSSCTETNPYYVPVKDLFNMNMDIDMGECLFQDNNSLSISRGDNGNYTYTVRIICSKEFDGQNDSDKIASPAQLNSKGIYYKS